MEEVVVEVAGVENHQTSGALSERKMNKQSETLHTVTQKTSQVSKPTVVEKTCYSKKPNKT